MRGLNRRYLLSLAIILIIGLALGVAFGLAGYTGLVATQCSFLAVFILFGLGVDDMFLLVDAYDRFHATQDITVRCAQACREVGSSILFTSLTTFLALLVGSTIDLPAVQSFCITTAVAVAFVFSITIFMFVPLLVLNERRIAANRYDIAPCFVSSRARPKTEAHAAAVAKRVEQNLVRRFMRKLYVPSLTYKWSPPVVVVGFLVMFAAMGSYGIQNVGKHFNAFDYLPDGSELRQFINIERGYFGNVIDLDFLLGHPELNDPAAVTSLCTLDSRVNALSFVLHSDLMPFWGGLYANYYGHICATSAAHGGWNCSEGSTAPPLADPSHDCFQEFITWIGLLDSGRLTENFRFGGLTASGELPVLAAK